MNQAPIDVTEQLTELLQGIEFAFSQPLDSVEQITPLQEEQIRYAAALAAFVRFFLQESIEWPMRTVSSTSAMH